MIERFPVLAGAEPWSSDGNGEHARTGVVVVHGFTGSPVTMRPYGEVLARAGFAVEVIRLPGHGTSYKDMIHTGYSDYRAAVLSAVESLRKRVDRVAVAGLSMGGMLCLDVGSDHPDKVAGVISINAPILDREGIVAKLAPLIAKVIPAVPASAAGLAKNDAARPGVDEKAYDMVPTGAGATVTAALPVVRARLRSLTQPILIAYSPNDHSVPSANSKALPGLVGSKDVTVVVLERSFHLATLDLDREQLEEASIAFLQRLGAN